MDLQEFEASLVCSSSFRTARAATLRNALLKNQKLNQTKQNKNLTDICPSYFYRLLVSDLHVRRLHCLSQLPVASEGSGFPKQILVSVSFSTVCLYSYSKQTSLDLGLHA